MLLSSLEKIEEEKKKRNLVIKIEISQTFNEGRFLIKSCQVFLFYDFTVFYSEQRDCLLIKMAILFLFPFLYVIFSTIFLNFTFILNFLMIG